MKPCVGIVKNSPRLRKLTTSPKLNGITCVVMSLVGIMPDL